MLTRISALSWKHAQTSQALVPITFSGQIIEPGVVIAFSAKVDVTTIDSQHVFQVLVVDPRERSYALGLRCACPVDGMVIPVKPNPSSGLITSATAIPVPADNLVDAVAFIFTTKPGSTHSNIASLILGGNRLDMWVRVRGDFILDAAGNAVDAEFVRAELPTGDYRKKPFPPPPDAMCIQGSVFESWFMLPADQTTPGRPGLSLVGINRGTRAELRTLPGIGAAVADKIIAARDTTPLAVPEDLRAYGVPDAVIERIRDRIRFD